MNALNAGTTSTWITMLLPIKLSGEPKPMRPYALHPPETPPPDPPEPNLVDALPCPKCGCKPDWDADHLGSLKVICCGINSGWCSTLDKAIRNWDEAVMELGDNESEIRKTEGQKQVAEHNEEWIGNNLN